jgi:hypothetical protein
MSGKAPQLYPENRGFLESPFLRQRGLTVTCEVILPIEYDPLKLQKQVDFLEAHPGCTICCHKARYVYQDQEIEPGYRPEFDEDKLLTIENLFEKDDLVTNTIMFRNMDLDDVLDNIAHLPVGDYPLFMYLAQFGDIGYLNEVMSVYRLHKGGLHSSLDYVSQLQIKIECLQFFQATQGYSKNRALKKSIAEANFLIARHYFTEKNKKLTIHFIKKCLRDFRYLERGWKIDIFYILVNAYFPFLLTMRNKLR